MVSVTEHCYRAVRTTGCAGTKAIRPEFGRGLRAHRRNFVNETIGSILIRTSRRPGAVPECIGKDQKIAKSDCAVAVQIESSVKSSIVLTQPECG